MKLMNLIACVRHWTKAWTARFPRLQRRLWPAAETRAAQRPEGERPETEPANRTAAEVAAHGLTPRPPFPRTARHGAAPPAAAAAGETGRTEKPGLTEGAWAYVQTHYEARYNVIDRRAELRRRDEPDAPFRPLDEVVRNTIVIELHRRGCLVWNVDVERILASLLVPQYHPFAAYMAALPAWDGTERADALARRVADDTLWQRTFHIWLRALAVQWAGGTHTPTGNQMVPLLISERQGMRKSTFCRLLVPPALRAYYTDKFELSARDNLELSLSRFGLINLDEFDRYGERQMAKLKNLVQLGRMAVRRPYAAQFTQTERIASFIGTSNRTDLLTDRTGSRRFYCQRVEHAIDCETPIDHGQLFAQLLHEWRTGGRTYFTPAEEAEIQRHNRAYYRTSVLRDLFLRLFAPAPAAAFLPVARAGETASAAACPLPGAADAAAAVPEKCQAAGWVGVTQLFGEMHRVFGRLMAGETPMKLGRQLAILGVPSRHTRFGTQYYVVRRTDAAAGE